MRILNPAILAKIATKLGTEPVNILEVQWVADGPFLKYGDKDISIANIDGVILEISTLESVLKLDGAAQSQGISVKLSDSSGKLKDIFNNHDIHGKTCILFQWFDSLPLDEKFKLYEGQITSPIEWSEGDRTLSFSVITQLEDKEVGFSPEEGLFPFIPKDKVGVAWPLVFGTVVAVPAVRLSQIATTIATTTIGIKDPSLRGQLSFMGVRENELKALFEFYAFAAAFVSLTADPDGDSNAVAAEGVLNTLESQLAQIAITLANLRNDRNTLVNISVRQSQDQNSTLTVADASGFPSGTITLQAADIILTGSFSGNTFIIDNLNLTEYKGFNGTVFGFTFKKEGALVTIKSTAPVIYVANLLPGTVSFVQAFKQVENGRLLSIVDRSLFTVATEDINGYTITYLFFNKPLSGSDNTFEDEIFVTQTSTVGPNTVDIIQFLIEKYTNLTVDTATFATVKTQIDNYPSHFALLERRNVLSVVEDIAFQARCAIWISGGVVFLKYLSEEETEVDTLTEADLDAGSLSVFTTTTEELVTKLTATWKEDLSIPEPNKIVLRNNVSIYGLREREIDFFIYNIDELVLKSATFWIIRFSNMWKHISFKTQLDKLRLETFDTVKFNFASDFIADTAIKGRLTVSIYNSDEKTISMEAWLPIKIGTMKRYDFAEPQNISITLFYPTQEEIKDDLAGGGGPGATVEGTVQLSSSFLSSVGFRSRSARVADGERIQAQTFGDQIPSDLDDVKPSVFASGYTFAAGQEPSYDYQYDDYPLNFADAISKDELSFAYPGEIISGSGDTYGVNVYKLGLSGEPEFKILKQLQIVGGVNIPINTWVIVMYNKWIEDDEIKDEYTMQSPVWV